MQSLYRQFDLWMCRLLVQDCKNIKIVVLLFNNAKMIWKSVESLKILFAKVMYKNPTLYAK